MQRDPRNVGLGLPNPGKPGGVIPHARRSASTLHVMAIPYSSGTLSCCNRSKAEPPTRTGDFSGIGPVRSRVNRWDSAARVHPRPGHRSSRRNLLAPGESDSDQIENRASLQWDNRPDVPRRLSASIAWFWRSGFGPLIARSHLRFLLSVRDDGRKGSTRMQPGRDGIHFASDWSGLVILAAPRSRSTSFCRRNRRSVASSQSIASCSSQSIARSRHSSGIGTFSSA
jgi:hypothetical protein